MRMKERCVGVKKDGRRRRRRMREWEKRMSGWVFMHMASVTVLGISNAEWSFTAWGDKIGKYWEAKNEWEWGGFLAGRGEIREIRKVSVPCVSQLNSQHFSLLDCLHVKQHLIFKPNQLDAPPSSSFYFQKYHSIGYDDFHFSFIHFPLKNINFNRFRRVNR